MSTISALDTLVNRPITAATGVSVLPDLEPTTALPAEHADVERFADARPVWADPPTLPDNLAAPVPEAEPAAEAVAAEPAAEPALEPAAPEAVAAEPAAVPAVLAVKAEPAAAEAVATVVPSGPRLHLRVESGTSMIATLDGESEPITIDELRVAAGALTRADGSAAIATTSSAFEARALAQNAFEILTDARVQTSMSDYW